MGGDNAPDAEVEGAILASREYGVRVLVAGREEILIPALAQADPGDAAVEVLPASDVITMDDSAAKALRSKPDSSIHIAVRAVREERAHGFVSAGNTGAVMATSLKGLGRAPGVYRPALAQVFPTLKGTWTTLLDVGANVDCTPEMLAQFAVMGEIYSRIICHCDDPRVGVLAIGEEEHKGNELTKLVTPLLKALPLKFVGNVEGQDIYSGDADVIVCDGFVGNVALKVSEGLVSTIKAMLTESLEKTLPRKIGYMMARQAFEDFRKRVDYTEYGGAPLLGVKGVVLICHGRSNANAIKNAVRVAAELARGNVTSRIEESLAASLESVGPAEQVG